MGDGVGITCPKCGYNLDAMQGIGFDYYDLRNMLRCVPARKRQHVTDILNNHSIQTTDCEQELMVCPKCGRFAARFRYRIAYDNGQIEESVYHCNHCRTRLVTHDGNMEVLNRTLCPECHGAMLTTMPHCPWD